MKLLMNAFAVIVLSVSSGFSQGDPVAVLGSSWQRTVMPPNVVESTASTPVRAVIAENKNFRRKAREQQSPGALDPNELTIDGRSAAIDRAVQESRAPKVDPVQGYSYFATMRNESGQRIEIIFWEFRFTEIANPSNIARRQFVCAANMKNGEQKALSAFSLLGPSDVVAVESLAKPGEKAFKEEVIINRMELADGSILQRHGWKFADVQKAVERVTSAPWGTETCRLL